MSSPRRNVKSRRTRSAGRDMFGQPRVRVPRDYRFGRILQRVLNWPDPPDDLGVREIRAAKWCRELSEECLEDVRLSARFLRRMAEAYLDGQLLIGADGSISLPRPKAEVEADEIGATLAETEALSRLHAEARRLRVLGFGFGCRETILGGREGTLEVWQCYIRPAPFTGAVLPPEALPPLAAEELWRAMGDQRFTLARCPAPGPWNRGTCERWFVGLPRGRQQEYCSPVCQRRAARWTRKKLKMRRRAPEK